MNVNTTDLQLGLQSIRLQSMILNMDPAFDPMIPNQQLIANFGVKAQRVGKGVATLPDGTVSNTVIFLTTFQFEFHHARNNNGEIDPVETSTGPVVATIKADIASTYVGNMFETMDQDSINSWGATAAIHHQWPYWRELCHSTLSRMALPVILMPLHLQAIQIEKTVPEAAELSRPKPKKATRRRSKPTV